MRIRCIVYSRLVANNMYVTYKPFGPQPWANYDHGVRPIFKCIEIDSSCRHLRHHGINSSVQPRTVEFTFQCSLENFGYPNSLRQTNLEVVDFMAQQNQYGRRNSFSKTWSIDLLHATHCYVTSYEYSFTTLPYFLFLSSQ